MNSDPFHDLLRNADEHYPAPRLEPELTRRIRRRATRRRKVRAAAAILLATLIIAPLARMHFTRPGASAVSAPSLADDPDEIAFIAQRTADDILARRKEEPAVSAPSSIDPMIQLHVELDQTAAILLAGGDHLMRQPGQTKAAAAEYRQARDLFPATPAAATAAERLRQFGL